MEFDNQEKTDLVIKREEDSKIDENETAYTQVDLKNAQGFILPDRPSIYVIVGSPASGKSHLVKHLMLEYMKAGYFKFGMTICPTAFTGGYDFVPEHSVLTSFDMDKIQEYLDKLKTHKKQGKTIPPNYLIFDDGQGLINFYDTRMSSLIATYRHTNTTIFFVTQYLAQGSSTLLRECASYFFVFASKFERTLKGLYQAVGQMFPNYYEFLEVFKHATSRKHDCLLYVNRDTYKVEDAYFIYRADDEIPDFYIDF